MLGISCSKQYRITKSDLDPEILVAELRKEQAGQRIQQIRRYGLHLKIFVAQLKKEHMHIPTTGTNNYPPQYTIIQSLFAL